MQNSDLTSSGVDLSRKVGNSSFRRLIGVGGGFFPNITRICAWTVVGLLLVMLVILVIESWDAIVLNPFAIFSGTTWDPGNGVYGALPAIFGTILSACLALIVAVPISFGAAVFLSEIAPAKLRTVASFFIEMLAAIPSVIVGMWGLFVLVPFVRDPVQRLLGEYFGFLPLFQGPPLGYGFLSAAIILAVMIIPIITSMSREVLRTVPTAQREAMLALGATKWETISRVVLPYGRSGLVGAVILGLGRALGETMAVTMVIGNSNGISWSLFSTGTTIAGKMALELGESGGITRAAIIELALVLFAITLFVNVIARLMVWRVTKVKGVKF